MDVAFSSLNILGSVLYKHVVSHGFQGKPIHTDMLLMISEIIEAFEDDRIGKSLSDKIPPYTPLQEEMADLIIRVLTFCYEHELNIGAVVEAKHKFNLTRPYKHGKAF